MDVSVAGDFVKFVESLLDAYGGVEHHFFAVIGSSLLAFRALLGPEQLCYLVELHGRGIEI